MTSSLGGKYDVMKLSFFGIILGQNSSSLIFCPMELKFGTRVNSEALISNSSQKIRHKYHVKEKKEIIYEKLKIIYEKLKIIYEKLKIWLILHQFNLYALLICGREIGYD